MCGFYITELSYSGREAGDRQRAGCYEAAPITLRGSVMMKKPNCPIIAIEEHYWDPELAKHFTGPEAGRGNETDERLFDLGSLRLKEMDEAGIDIQVLSHGAPSTQKLGADIAADLTRQVNDRLAKLCAANPKRFAAFASLPTADPKAAADELERTVTKLGFKGAMLHGMSNGEFLDLKKFWPIYERAENSTCRSISTRRCRIRR